MIKLAQLYDVEKLADQEKCSFKEYSDLRSRLTYANMVAFEKWLVNEYSNVLPKGFIGHEIRYT